MSLTSPRSPAGTCGNAAKCTAAAQKLARELSVCNEWRIPEPDPELGRSVWAAIAPRLEEPHSYRFRWLKVASALAVMATLLVTAFIAGRASHPPRPSLTAGLSRQARERILAISLADHLGRAEMLLTEISNVSETNAAEMSDDRGRAQDLVEEGRIMRQTLAREGDDSTLALLDEVERFMLSRKLSGEADAGGNGALAGTNRLWLAVVQSTNYRIESKEQTKIMRVWEKGLAFTLVAMAPAFAQDKKGQADIDAAMAQAQDALSKSTFRG